MAEAMLNEEYLGSVPNFHEIPQEQEVRSRGAKRSSRERTSKETKSVSIELPPQKKRKVASSATMKSITDAINKSLTPDDREEAISTAVTCLEHNEQSIHDEELASGMDVIIAKHLGYLLYRQDCVRGTNLSSEIGNTCKALELVYRGSVDSVSDSFKRNGEEVVPMLLKAIDDELSSRLCVEELSEEPEASRPDTPASEAEPSVEKAKEQPDDTKEAYDEKSDTRTTFAATAQGSVEGDMILCKATKTLGHFARVGDATRPLAHHQGLLSTLINLMAIRPYSAIPGEARMNAVWVVANLACNNDNMVMMACHPELLSSLLMLAARTVRKTTSAEVVMEVLRTQSIAVRALLNLSWAPENRIPMSEMSNLLKVLSRLSVYRQAPKRGKTLIELLRQTRRQTLGTLRNLAAAPRRNKIRLCQYENGKLLDVLTDAILNDSDEGVRQRAFATIHNLAIHDTAQKMVEHPALVLILKASHDDEDLKTFVLGTLMVLERSITEDMECYQNLRELLDAVNPTDTGSEHPSDAHV